VTVRNLDAAIADFETAATPRWQGRYSSVFLSAKAHDILAELQTLGQQVRAEAQLAEVRSNIASLQQQYHNSEIEIRNADAKLEYLGKELERLRSLLSIVDDSYMWLEANFVNIALDNYNGKPALAAGMSTVVDVDTGNKRSLPMISAL
jgi:multidrug resistance efflux pump